MGRRERQHKEPAPTPSAREAAIIESAWAAMTGAQVMLRTVDADEGIRAIVHVAGGTSWIHSGEETAARLQQLFPSLPEREQRLIIRHINTRISEKAQDQGYATRRKNWATGWMAER